MKAQRKRIQEIEDINIIRFKVNGLGLTPLQIGG